jgi:hypothetical protein
LSSTLPPQVRALIVDRISSVVQLEILLLLHAEPARSWTADDAATHFRIDPTWAEAQFTELAAQGLVRPLSGGSATTHQYAPKTADLARAVSDLSKAYNDMRVSVISLIYSKPTDTLKSFADAFRIRKDKDQADG